HVAKHDHPDLAERRRPARAWPQPPDRSPCCRKALQSPGPPRSRPCKGLLSCAEWTGVKPSTRAIDTKTIPHVKMRRRDEFIPAVPGHPLVQKTPGMSRDVRAR